MNSLELKQKYDEAQEWIDEQIAIDNAYRKEIKTLYDLALEKVEQLNHSRIEQLEYNDRLSLAKGKERATQDNINRFKANLASVNNKTSNRRNEALEKLKLTGYPTEIELIKSELELIVIELQDLEERALDEQINRNYNAEAIRQAELLTLGNTGLVNVLKRLNEPDKVQELQTKGNIENKVKIAELYIDNNSNSNITNELSDKYNRQALALAYKNGVNYRDLIASNRNNILDEVYKLIERALIRGENPKEAARNLDKMFHQKWYGKLGNGGYEYTAEQLAITETARAQIFAQYFSLRESTYKKYMFVAVGDERTCPICKGIDGEIYDIIHLEVAENAPPMHPVCRCTISAYY